MENADIDAVERRFLEMVKEHIQKVATSFDESEVRQEEAWLRDIHARYYQYILQWIADEMKQAKDPSHPDAAKLKKQGRDVMQELQNHITEFSSCYMHINRFMTLLRDEIRREEVRLAGHVAHNVKWTADAGTVISRYKQQKSMLVASNERMKKGRVLLEALEPEFTSLKNAIIRLYGADKHEATQRSIIAALRMMEFARARKALQDVVDGKKKFGLDQKTIDDSCKELLRCGGVIIDCCEKNKDVLVSNDGRLYLKTIETDQAYNAQVRELRKIKGFLSKYYFPYMQYKLDTLMHLKDKLLVNGSLESLMTLYMRLVSGMAKPIPDIKALRAYESEVLDRIKYLLTGQFRELPNILARSRELVAEFRQSADEFRDMESMELNEIDTGDESAVTA
jgi:hypothetical protein